MTGVLRKTERELIDDVQNRLADRFAQLPAERVSAAVDQAQARFAQSTIRDFVPLLVERRVAAELISLTRAEHREPAVSV
jgi:CRISPR/Cas system-associated exonuclease Cas4 (RecB family)